MKNTTLIPLLVISLLTSIGTAQHSKVVRGAGVFRIDLDNAKFFGDDSTTYVEIYYGIRERILTYGSDGGGLAGSADLKFVVWKDTIPILSKEWSVPHIIHDTAILSAGKTMVGLETFAVSPGSYRLQFIAHDSLDASRRDSFWMPLIVQAFPTGHESISDIELCSKVTSSSDKSGMFYKNTLNVVPNASLLYGVGLPTLSYYVEAYNLTSSGRTGDVQIRTTIADGMGNEALRQSKNKRRTYNSIVDFETIDISSLDGGTFTLELALTDSSEQIYARALKKFFVYKPGSNRLSAADSLSGAGQAASTEYALMSENEIDKEFAYSRYIASESERREYQSLKLLDAKRKFMFEFWRRRNPDPTSRRNSYKIEYLRRIEYANEHFKKGQKEGWRTDFGRVFIIYGPQDEVEQFPSSAESNPYEIWHYNALQGGVIFVFVDRNDVGHYLLVHSTHRDELHDENWYKEYARKAE